MIDEKEAEDFAGRLEKVPRGKSIEVKDLEIEVGMTSLFKRLVAAISVQGHQGIKEIFKDTCASIVRFAKWVHRNPEWVEEVIERMNMRVEGFEMRLRQREDEARQEAEWDVVSERRLIKEKHRRSDGWTHERLGRRRNFQVRTLKVQSQTTGLTGRFMML